jgi:hypothetical protein
MPLLPGVDRSFGIRDRRLDHDRLTVVAQRATSKRVDITDLANADANNGLDELGHGWSGWPTASGATRLSR